MYRNLNREHGDYFLFSSPMASDGIMEYPIFRQLTDFIFRISWIVLKKPRHAAGCIPLVMLVVAVVVVVLIMLHTVDATGHIFLSLLGCSSHLAGGSLLLDRMESDKKKRSSATLRSAAELYHFFDIQFSICFGSPNFAA